MTTAYEAPRVEVIEVQVEQGFATSNTIDPWNTGSTIEGTVNNPG